MVTEINHDATIENYDLTVNYSRNEIYVTYQSGNSETYSFKEINTPNL